MCLCVREWPDTCGYTPYPTRAHVRAHTRRRITIMGEHRSWRNSKPSLPMLGQRPEKMHNFGDLRVLPGLTIFNKGLCNIPHVPDTVPYTNSFHPPNDTLK